VARPSRPQRAKAPKGVTVYISPFLSAAQNQNAFVNELESLQWLLLLKLLCLLFYYRYCWVIFRKMLAIKDKHSNYFQFNIPYSKSLPLLPLSSQLTSHLPVPLLPFQQASLVVVVVWFLFISRMTMTLIMNSLWFRLFFFQFFIFLVFLFIFSISLQRFRSPPIEITCMRHDCYSNVISVLSFFFFLSLPSVSSNPFPIPSLPLSLFLWLLIL